MAVDSGTAVRLLVASNLASGEILSTAESLIKVPQHS